MAHPTVVVGAGQAGCQVVSSLRDAGFDGPLTLIGAETHLPYQRPPLSKGHLTGQAARENLWLRPAAWFGEHAIDLRVGTRATSLDRAGQSLTLSNGSSLTYANLILATGARSRDLAVEGADLEGVVFLRTLDDADDIKARLERANNVVVIGGGFIGMEVAATSVRLGKTTTVIEVADQLMGRVLSADTSTFLLAAHRARGLRLELGTGVSRIVGVEGRARAVDTSDGRRLEADLVLVGIGAVPNVELAESGGLLIENGIVVDEFLRTSDEHVFGVGDCVSAPNPYASGARVRLESVQNAVAQARAVAATLAGHPEPFCSVPWFWSDQADLKLQIAGLTTGHHEVVIKGEMAAEKFSAYCFTAGRLVGVESINRPAEHLAARRLLAAPTPPTAQQVGARDFDAKGFASDPVS